MRLLLAAGSLRRNSSPLDSQVIGLKPAGDNGTYFQPVTIVEAKVDPSATLTVSGGETRAAESLKYSTDFVAFSGLEQADVSR